MRTVLAYALIGLAGAVAVASVAVGQMAESLSPIDALVASAWLASLVVAGEIIGMGVIGLYAYRKSRGRRYQVGYADGDETEEIEAASPEEAVEIFVLDRLSRLDRLTARDGAAKRNAATGRPMHVAHVRVRDDDGQGWRKIKAEIETGRNVYCYPITDRS